MRRIRFSECLCTIFAMGLFLLSHIAQGQEGNPTNVNLCSLIAHPGEFNKKRVRINARVESTVIEGGTWLKDVSCEQRGGVELSIPDSIRNHPEKHLDFKALDDAIRRQGNVGTVGKRITATVIGRFYASSKRTKLVLALEKVENLDVEMEKSSKRE